MSVDITLTYQLTWDAGNETRKFPDDADKTSTITVTNGYVHEVRNVVVDDYTVQAIWTTGDGGIDTFELLYFISDADVFLELRNTQATDEFVMVECKANVPFILNSDDTAGYTTTSRLDGSQLVEATDYDQVDKISVYNNAADDAGDATVHLILMT